MFGGKRGVANILRDNWRLWIVCFDHAERIFCQVYSKNIVPKIAKIEYPAPGSASGFKDLPILRKIFLEVRFDELVGTEFQALFDGIATPRLTMGVKGFDVCPGMVHLVRRIAQC